MDQNYSNDGQGLGIAGLVIGIIALFLAFIPCTAIPDLILCIIAIGLSGFGLYKANQANASKGLQIAALIVSILAFLIAGIWGVIITKVVTNKDFKRNFKYYDKKYDDLDSLKIFEKSDTLNIKDSLNIKDETLDKLEQDMDKLHKQKKDQSQPVTDSKKPKDKSK
jgi:hypothetical protein